MMQTEIHPALVGMSATELLKLRSILDKIKAAHPDTTGLQIDLATLARMVRDDPDAFDLATLDEKREEAIRAKTYELMIYDFIEDREEARRMAERKIDREEADAVLRKTRVRIRPSKRRRRRR